MERTPIQKSKLSRRNSIYKQNAREDKKNIFSSSPKHTEDTDVDSPLQIPLTQEGWENVDVVWDWNSPQGKSFSKKSKKRLILSQSPKVPIKRHPSHNSVQGFEKLREEIQALRNEIAIPENEDLLRLSPVEEADYKNISDNSLMDQMLENDDFDNLFNSPLNAQLIELSVKNSGILDDPMPNRENVAVSPHKNLSFRKVNKNSDISKLANDSFEALLGEVDIEQFTSDLNDDKSESLKNCTDTDSHMSTEYHNNHKSTGKVEFYRTESFELSNWEQITGIPREQVDGIEKKRQEALAKRSKRKPDPEVSPTVIITNTQCSTEEIERKRKQALAKLEAKREQEIIERKRLEALKRLQSRKKNAPTVKSSLTKRLDWEMS
ncbi:hypothetical protein JTB14_031488 [Gonioctena quinquepunctata]|nr:hypothetical protein JTB14_031488 [Gonioctena quinquepunctata]